MWAMPSRIATLLIYCLLIAERLWSQSPPSSPAPADLSQEAFVFERLSLSVRFENDGSGVRETTAAIRIQSQAGVEAFGQLVFGYSTANEDLKIDYARVRAPDRQVVETPASSTQDFAREALRQAPRHSAYRQRN